MFRLRILPLIFAGAAVLCLIGVRRTHPQSILRRITNTTEEGININPTISGDGRIVAFESTEDIAGAGGGDRFRAIRANIAVDPATFFQMGGTRAVAPAISQDGSRIAFASKDDPLGTNPDGNSEIFLFDGARLSQVTNTSPGDIANRVTNGNFQPSISDDGRFIAFSSNRDLVNSNADGNLEIFVYDTLSTTFTQLTNSTGIVGASDAKISGDGQLVAFIRETGAAPSAKRDLVLQSRIFGPDKIIESQVQALAMTYGRAISDDHTRVVYSAETAANSSQVFLFDGRGGNSTRQITSLVGSTKVPLHATISGDGTRIAFATTRPVTGTASNSDGSVELYVYDIPSATFSRITNAPSTATADVVSSLNDDGSIVAFSFPRVLSGAVTDSNSANNSEIYVTATPPRPPFGTLSAILNGASFGNEPSTTKAVAPDSIAVARGNNLANTTSQSQRLPNGTFPTNVGGTTVTVNGRSAQIFFVSPGQVNFLVPPATEIGTADVVVTNSENFQSRGSVPTLRAAPGVFTKPGDGNGEGMILNSDTLQPGPFDPTSGNLRLTIFTTGARNATRTLVAMGGRVVNADSVMASPDMPGLDEVRVLVPSDLRGSGTVNLSVQSDGRDGNPVAVTFNGDPGRDIFINEVLADPPDGIAGDANHDGLRDGTQDEFVELVNGTSSEAISLSGWTIRTRPTGSATETTRVTFASGTTLSAGEAIVVFGGGSFNPNDPVFGCAQVVRATSSSGLSLTNGGLTILIRDGSGNQIKEFSYGGSTGLNGSNSQSLTRSPDITGSFVQHTTIAGARKFSPGLKVDGTPFGNCPGHPASVTISPPTATISVGQTTQFTAQAFDQFGRAMTGVMITFASDNATVATVDSTSTNPGTGIATATVGAHNPGTAHITATATDGMTTANSSQATLTVTGPSLTINDVTLNEGNSGPTRFNFLVSLNQPAPTGGVTFNIATQDSTAIVSDNDYVARSLTAQTIPVGQQTYNFAVTVNGDLNIEPTETFFVNVTNVTGASLGDGQGLGTIVNDDSPSLSVNDVSANEGNSGTTTFVFTVMSTLPAPAGGITFDIATADGTATSASGDYLARSLTGQTIPAGQTTYTFNVTVNGDTFVEPDETFFVNISNVSANASVSDGQGLGTILNDDTATVVISEVYGGGGNTGAQFRNDFVEIFNRGTSTVDLAGWSVQQASATGTSWSVTALCPTGPCLLAAGKYFLVQEASSGAIGANLPTPDATGTSNLGATSGKIALVNNSSALVGSGCPFGATIVDFVGYGMTADCSENSTHAATPSNTTADLRKSGGCIDTNDNAADFLTSAPNPRNSSSPANDCSTGFRPDIGINDVSVTEGDAVTKTVDFTVTLSAANATQTVTVNYATADGTAVAGSDYQSTSGTLSFSPGQTSKPITVTIIGDRTQESNETFFVNLSNASNAVILDDQGQGTITNDDIPPTLTINDVSQNEGDSGTTTFRFVVSLSAPALAGGVTFDIATQDSTAAVANNDYVARSLTNQTIAAGSSTYTFDVTVNGDTNIEPNESFFVNVTNVSGATVGDGQGLGTILNDDSPVLSINDVSGNEGNTGTSTFTFTVGLTQPAQAGGVTFDIATADGTAKVANNDYAARSLTAQTIPAGQSSYMFDVTVNGDTLVEPNETFLVNVTNVTGATVLDGQGKGTIQNDDTSNLVISQVYGGGNNSGAPYRNDLVEIFNRGATTVDFSVTPYSVQYASVGSNFGSSKTNLTTGTISPGHYFLIQESGGTSNGVALPTPDATGTIAMAAASGKVALVVGTTALSVSACPGDDGSSPFNPSDSTIADFVGYGDTAATAGHCHEGPGPAAAPSNTTADFRKAGGCTDTGNNTADFLVSGPFPRNSSSPANNCGGGAAPNLTINEVAVAEGNSGTTTATFTVSLSAPAQGTDVTFDIATADGTATIANSDYVAKSLTNQVIPAGETTYSFSVTVNGDVNVEPDETLLVNVMNANGATITDGQGIGTIQNDDFPTLSINDVSVNEGNSGTTTFNFTVSLSAPAPAPVTFDIATQDGTATVADNDYVARNLTSQTIATGPQTYNFAVTVNGDTNLEANETFLVNVTNVAGATILDGQGQGTILNDDSLALTINDVSANEGNGGTSTFTFTVSLSQPAQAGGVTFDIATADGTATVANSDYVARSLAAQTIPAGQSSYIFDVAVNGDTNVETNETFLANVTNVTGATVLDGQGQGTIQNDDTANLVIGQVYPGGGLTNASFTNDFIELFNRGATTVDFSVTPYSVQFLSTSGTTWAKTDLTSGTLGPGRYFLIKETSGGAVGAALPPPDATGTINITSTTAGKVALVAGATLLTGNCPGDDGSAPFNPVDVTVVDFVGYLGTAATANHCYEGAGPASFTSGSNTTADFRKAGGCTDTNDNAADFLVSGPFPRNSSSPTNNCAGGATPNLTINDVTVAEGNSGTTTATFTVSLSAPAQGADVTFDITTQNNTATTANNDYVAKSLTGQIIPAGQITYTFTVTVNGDITVEPDETFFVNVTNASGATITDGQGIGSIQNDDLPTLSINDVSLTEGNSGTKLFTFTVSLSVAAPATVTFDIATQDDTATVANNDYVARSLTGQTIAAGQQTYTFDVTVNGDTAIETNETFFVNVTNVSGATILDGQGVGTIQNDDSPALSINSVTVTEGNSSTTPATFTVTLSPSSSQTVMVDYATSSASPATAAAGTDYVATSGTLSFAPGQTTQPITVQVNGDTTNEAICETFFVNLSNPTNATISPFAGQGQGGITDDDGTKLVISQVYGGGGNTGAQFTNDFIEIFNRGNTAVSLNGVSVQYSAATSTSGSFSVTALPNVSLQPGQYFLIQEASGGAVGSPLPTPDATGTIAMAATAGKVALVNGTTALSAVGCPSGATILDFVGYGTTANCREGSTTADNAPAPSNTTADLRKLSGCQDTNNSNTDFTAGAPTPRNTATALGPCSCSTSYSSLFTLDRESWKTSLATLFIDRPKFPQP